ncbi:MAK10-like protein [Tanacetum coccineum]
MGDENPIHTLGDYSKPSHEGYRNTIELPIGNNVAPLQSYTIQLLQNGCSFHGLRFGDLNKHLKDFLKLMDSLDLDGANRERTRLRLFQFSLCNQASNWLKRLLAGSITTWEDLTTRFLAQFFPPRITSKLLNDIMILTIDQSTDGKLYDLNAEESWALLDDLALYDNESWNDLRDFSKPVKTIVLPQDFSSTSDHRLIELENQVPCLMEAHLTPTQPTQVNKITTSCEICSGPHDTQYCMEDPEQAFVEYASSRTDEARYARLSKLEADFKQQQSKMTNKIDTVLKAITDRIAGTLPSDTIGSLLSNTKLICTKGEDGNVMFIVIIPKDDNSCKEEPEAGEQEVEYFDVFPTRSELAYHKRKLDPRENVNGGVSNFTRRIKGMHVFIGNFTYIMDFMIIEDISSIIDPRLSQVVLGKHFVEISNMTHNPPEGVVRFTNENNEVVYKMPHKIEQYDSFLNLEKEHTKLVYLMNGEGKRRGVEYVMSKILGFYKECLELIPEYLTGMDDEGEVM